MNKRLLAVDVTYNLLAIGIIDYNTMSLIPLNINELSIYDTEHKWY
jgi:hypothetical protein